MARVRSLDEQRQRDMDRLGLQYRAARTEAGTEVLQTTYALGARRGAAHLAINESLRLLEAVDVHQWSTSDEQQRIVRAHLIKARAALEAAERAILKATAMKTEEQA